MTEMTPEERPTGPCACLFTDEDVQMRECAVHAAQREDAVEAVGKQIIADLREVAGPRQSMERKFTPLTTTTLEALAQTCVSDALHTFADSLEAQAAAIRARGKDSGQGEKPGQSSGQSGEK